MTPTPEKLNGESPALLIGLLRFVNFMGRFAARMHLPIAQFSEHQLLRRARKKTGLTDFGDENFLPSFRVLLQSMQEGGERQSLAQRLANQATVLSALTNRLLIAQELKGNPRIPETPICRPIFIASLPRSGTTFLHRLLAQDPHARPLLAWESFFPARRLSELRADPDPRIRRVQRKYDFLNAISPGFRAVHSLEATAPEECNMLLKNAFLFTGNSSPAYRNWLLEQPPEFIEDAYRMYRTQLQLIQTNRPQDGHWLLKAPFHLYGMDALFKLFPDCSVVMTHRDPHVSLPSLYSMASRVAALELEDREQIEGLALYLFGWAAEGIRRAEAARAGAQPGRVFDIQYQRLVEDPLGTVQGLYAHFDYSYTDEFHTRAQQWLDQHPKHKFGKHAYSHSLEEHGVSHQMIDEAFGGYCDRYQIPSECDR